jgi:hypothetical protein
MKLWQAIGTSTKTINNETCKKQKKMSTKKEVTAPKQNKPIYLLLGTKIHP